MSRVPKHITNQADIDYLINIEEKDIGLSFLLDLFGEFDNKVKFHPYDTIDIPIGAYGKTKKNKKVCRTTVGLWVFNKYFIENDLFDIFQYINYEINSKTFNDLVQQITDEVMEDNITIDELELFLQKSQKLMPLCTVLTPNQTEKFLNCTKELNKMKARLAKQYEKEIDAGDPAIAEKMEQELLEFAKEYLKDDPSMDIYLSGARSTLGNHFKNMYIMKGAVRDLNPDADKEYNIVLSNYSDGISKDDYTIMANSLAAGPYARSKKTAIGGYWEKLFSVYQYLRTDSKDSDCGTSDTIDIFLSEKNYRNWMYSYVKTSSGYEAITPKNYQKYINRNIKLRFSALCESKTGFCNKCIGDLPYKLDVKNIGSYMPKIPSVLKNVAMKSFHVSNISMATIDVDKAFGVSK